MCYGLSKLPKLSFDGTVCFYKGSYGLGTSPHYKVSWRKIGHLFVLTIFQAQTQAKIAHPHHFTLLCGRSKNEPLVNICSRQKFNQVNMFKMNICTDRYRDRYMIRRDRDRDRMDIYIIGWYILFYIYEEIYFKELNHMIVGAGKSKIPRACQQARNSGQSSCRSLESKIYRAGQQLEIQAGFLLILKQNSFFSLKAQFLFLRSSTNWMIPTP